MRAMFNYLVVVIVGLILISLGSGPSASARTVEAGDAMTSWIGTGDVHELGEGNVVINGTLRGVMFVRHYQGAVRGPIHAAKLQCQVRVSTETKNDHRESVGICTIIAHEGKDIAYAQWKCAGKLEECEGDFTFTGGAGGLSGIAGTTPFRSRIDIERLEVGKSQAFGYAYWPKLTFTLP